MRTKWVCPFQHTVTSAHLAVNSEQVNREHVQE